ncbi:hypothetical protein GCM10022297_08010 [Lactobacillus hamsteri]|uniref:YSIRK-type signal peptide-containing protein n=1 Tax=Lactobacillus hamsteri TaxID=96565 RepID=UPI000468883E|nr:YSIRK-type signal peptide-containing protein [Lactobacillus hamsteri]
MVGRNNFLNKMQSNMERKPHYGIRKLGVGVASVLLSTTLYLGTVSSNHVLADTNDAENENASTEISGGYESPLTH